ncbi:MAG: penicillin-binding protein [Micavibrio aeruginosavorus]|uniref:Penicillin-binding protein 1A n=1 Tax=Micavibrio aeruginosavorus TaxID=349221 RepID=A0A2W5A5N3_9BACT|nr:MAG: penicillin-binding protein [Micavibrio aeruginosavorus]
MRWLGRLFLALISIGFLGAIAGIGGVALLFAHFGRDLPDYTQLKKYEPPIVTRIYAGDGRLLAEYAREKRVFVPVTAMPDMVKNAFIAAEDQNFYRHPGIDATAIARAAISNVINPGARMKGASTITQQVAKNFLLTNERSYERKIKEAILSMRMEKAMTKDQILELYLNEIYLGQRSYGVAAAAQTYFDKKLDDLTVAEAAYLAALPKAPNNYHPVRNHNSALTRRNWVVDRMTDDGYVTSAQAELAKATPLAMTLKDESDVVNAPFFAEDVRRILKDKYGEDSLYNGGLTVRTSVDPRLQDIAVETLRKGLMDYDRRHGWRGPVKHFDSTDTWHDDLISVEEPGDMPDEWTLAMVLENGSASARIGFADKETGTLSLDGVKWARKCMEDCYALGPEITAVSDVVKKGDVIFVEGTGKSKDKYVLRQIPAVQGALVAIDPHTGRVLAMQGGWKYGPSQFNRVTQAERQPGSAFKPFVYLAALDKGFTPATRVLDAPFVMEQAPGDYWRPTNYSGQVYGPTPIRVGVEKSRNLMTVRLADHLGMKTVVEYAKRFGIADDMKPYLSYALGAGETTLLKLTSAYAMIVNGGRKITPTMIDRIQDRRGATIFSYDDRPCPNCGDLIRWDGQSTPEIPDGRERIADERTAYQMVSILEGVVERGTAAKLKELERPLAGKTGTTNKSKDTWFIGFSPDLVVGVFVGFDDPKSLGKRETGASTTVPIFGDFMKEALKDTPATPFRVPPGIKNVRINASTGRAAMPGDKNIIWEAFVTGTEPNLDDYVLDTNVIGGGNVVDPYADASDNQFGFSEGAPVEQMPSGSDPYGQPEETAPQTDNRDPLYPSSNDSFTTFSRGAQDAQPQEPTPVYPPTGYESEQQPAPSINGTGGIY